ncbi:hypothetical protein SRIMM317S_02179 [Streptomyces rimosus subsp. rimosus]
MPVGRTSRYPSPLTWRPHACQSTEAWAQAARAVRHRSRWTRAVGVVPAAVPLHVQGEEEAPQPRSVPGGALLVAAFRAPDARRRAVGGRHRVRESGQRQSGRPGVLDVHTESEVPSRTGLAAHDPAQERTPYDDVTAEVAVHAGAAGRQPQQHLAPVAVRPQPRRRRAELPAQPVMAAPEDRHAGAVGLHTAGRGLHRQRLRPAVPEVDAHPRVAVGAAAGERCQVVREAEQQVHGPGGAGLAGQAVDERAVEPDGAFGAFVLGRLGARVRRLGVQARCRGHVVGQDEAGGSGTGPPGAGPRAGSLPGSRTRGVRAGVGGHGPLLSFTAVRSRGAARPAHGVSRPIAAISRSAGRDRTTIRRRPNVRTPRRASSCSMWWTRRSWAPISSPHSAWVQPRPDQQPVRYGGSVLLRQVQDGAGQAGDDRAVREPGVPAHRGTAAVGQAAADRQPRHRAVADPPQPLVLRDPPDQHLLGGGDGRRPGPAVERGGLADHVSGGSDVHQRGHAGAFGRGDLGEAVEQQQDEGVRATGHDHDFAAGVHPGGSGPHQGQLYGAGRAGFELAQFGQQGAVGPAVRRHGARPPCAVSRVYRHLVIQHPSPRGARRRPPHLCCPQHVPVRGAGDRYPGTVPAIGLDWSAGRSYHRRTGVERHRFPTAAPPDPGCRRTAAAERRSARSCRSARQRRVGISTTGNGQI